MDLEKIQYAKDHVFAQTLINIDDLHCSSNEFPSHLFRRDGSIEILWGGGGGGGCQMWCCVSHVHRPSRMEAGVTVVGIFASISSLG